MNLSSVAIVGTGPAALMAADVVSSAGLPVSIFEKRKSCGRKLLVAGSSGLNVTHDLPLSQFCREYRDSDPQIWMTLLQKFSPADWLRFIGDLGIPTFKGTSRRYFVEDMKAAKLLQSWRLRLESRGVKFYFDHECEKYRLDPLRLQFFGREESLPFRAVLFALGGGSWEPHENPLRWPSLFSGLGFTPFSASNAGFKIHWTEAFLREAEGLPLKNFELISSRGRKKGEAVITRYGLEGTPIYTLGEAGILHLDLKPDLSTEKIRDRLTQVRENLSPLRRIKKILHLCPAAEALIFHFTPDAVKSDLDAMIRHLKNFPLEFLGPQPLAEAISSRGGLNWSELDDRFMIKKHPGVFAAGEMLDWDAPTGGFLIQGCVTQGYCAGQGLLQFCSN